MNNLPNTDYEFCPCCGAVLHQYVQSYPAKYNRPNRLMVTCFNKDCAMEGLTLSPKEHSEKVLALQGSN